MQNGPYQQALAYAKDREQGTALTDKSKRVPIIEHADVKRMLMNMKAQIEAMRALTYEAALNLDLAAKGNTHAQEKVDLLTPVVKSCGTDMAVEVTSIGVQIHGGMGFVEETGAAQHYRDARILPIYEGTNGIQAMDLAFRKLIRDQGTAARAYLSDVELLVRDLDQVADKKFFDMRHALDTGVESLTTATSWMLDQSTKDIEAVAYSSAAYLKCFGIVAGGAMMIKAAVEAKAMLEFGQGNEDFLDEKIETARFYANHIMPQAQALSFSITKGDEF